eukprot:517169_1
MTTTGSEPEPQDFVVVNKLKDILSNADLTRLTRKEVRKQLEEQLGASFSSAKWKTRIKQEIEDFVTNQSNVTPNTFHNQQPPLPPASHSSTPQNAYQQSSKRRRLNNGASASTYDNEQNDNYQPPSYQTNHGNNYNNNNNNNSYHDQRKPMRPRLQSNRQLIQKSEKDNSYFMRLPGDKTKKRCVMHKYRSKLYVGFREYYEKNGQELPSKKGINLTEEQW